MSMQSGMKSNPTAHRTADLLSLGLILAAAWYGIFHLPYWAPPTQISVSYSYKVGFNNSVAVLATLAAIGLLCLRSVAWRQATPETVDSIFSVLSGKRSRSQPTMPRSVLVFFACIYLAATALLYICIPRLDEYGEVIDVLPRLELARLYGVSLYRDIGWPYGPALCYVPELFITVGQLFGKSADFSYFLCYEVNLVVSLLALFYLVDSLRIKVAYRVMIFSLVALMTYSVTLGIQYTLLRYVATYVTLLVFHKIATRTRTLTIPRLFYGRAVPVLPASCFLCQSRRKWESSISSLNPCTVPIACVLPAVHGSMFF